MKRIILLLSSLLFLCSASLGAQHSITVEEALQEAREHNSSLKQAELTLRGYERSRRFWINQFVSVQDPSFSLGNSAALYPSGEEASWNWGSLSLGATLSFSAGSYFQKRLTDSQYESALLSYENTKQSLLTQVSLSFYSLLTSQANLEMLKKDGEVKKNRYEKTAANYRQGLASELDLLNAEYDFRTSGPALSRAENGYREALSAFCLLIGRDPTMDLQLQGELQAPHLILPPAEDLIGRYRASRSDVIAARLAMEQRQLQARTSTLKGTPSLSIRDTLEYAPEKGSFPGMGDSRLTNSLSLSLSLPISSWIPGLSGAVSRADSADELQSAILAYEGALKSAGQDIWKQVNALEQAREALETTDLSSEIARKRYELSEEGYKGGLVSLDALQDAEQDLLSSRQNALQERVSYLQAHYNLAQALGMDVETLYRTFADKGE